ncbi:MAG: DUF3147 family protein [Syntrophomonadaceae bacterium]|nr:DUF3147 family protein [Syntrophomonadaceae bacterium]
MKQNLNMKDLALRFILGGSAVAVCYIMLQLMPWKSLAGIFAAFPAVMVAAVIMAGVFNNSRQAADVALGATAGMLGGAVCVITAQVCMTYLDSWSLSLLIATLAWFISSVACINLVQRFIVRS